MLIYKLTLGSLLFAAIPFWVLSRHHLGLWRRLLTAGLWSWGVWWGIAWPVVGFGLRWLWLVLVLAMAAAAFSRHTRESVVSLPLIKKIGWNTVFILGFMLVMGQALGRWYPSEPHAMNLENSLQGGAFAVLQGGSNGATNPGHAGGIQRERLAVDWVKLGRWGFRARGLKPDQLSAYHIYGDTVYAPINGIAIAHCDSLPELMPGMRDTINTRGNYVEISVRDSLTLLLAHLQPEKIWVLPGDSVKSGMPLGLVGNSGDSMEPHLHMSLSDSRGWAVPLLVRGVYPVLNRRFDSW
ncbi:MAG: M23 family metallopeptidase [Lentisphaeria bacterium]|nr:M23 family metallopeptidase [Candidatus Neomarinimicrobiota bacterium]MCF7842584.1 M23 family metallopeptidase [Lentisphaeria bacterium]